MSRRLKKMFEKESFLWKKEYNSLSVNDVYKIYTDLLMKNDGEKRMFGEIDKGYFKEMENNIASYVSKDTEKILNKKIKRNKDPINNTNKLDNSRKKIFNVNTRIEKKCKVKKEESIKKEIITINEDEDELKNDKLDDKNIRNKEIRENDNFINNRICIKIDEMKGIPKDKKTNNNIGDKAEHNDKKYIKINRKEEESEEESISEIRRIKEGRNKNAEKIKSEVTDLWVINNPYKTKEELIREKDYMVHENPLNKKLSDKDRNNNSDKIKKKVVEDELEINNTIREKLKEPRYRIPANINIEEIMNRNKKRKERDSHKKEDEKLDMMNIDNNSDNKKIVIKDIISGRNSDINSNSDNKKIIIKDIISGKKSDDKLKYVSVDKFSLSGMELIISSNIIPSANPLQYERPEDEIENKMFEHDPINYCESKIRRIDNRFFPMWNSELLMMKEVIIRDPLRYVQKNNGLSRDFINNHCGYDNVCNVKVNRFRYDLLVGSDCNGMKSWGNKKYFLFIRPGFFTQQDIAADMISLDSVNMKDYYGISTYAIKTKYTKNKNYNYVTYFYLKFKNTHHLPRIRFTDWLSLECDEKKINRIKSGIYGTMYIVQRKCFYEKTFLYVHEDIINVNELIYNYGEGKVKAITSYKGFNLTKIIFEKGFETGIWRRYRDFNFNPISD